MADYKTMYFQLFNNVSNVINLLQKAQLEGEETYLESNEAILTLLKDYEKKDD